MTIYAVILYDQDSNAWKNIAKEWPDRHFIVDDRLAFIKSSETELTKTISKRVGIDTDSEMSGIVIQLDYYSGTGSNSLVEWMQKNS